MYGTEIHGWEETLFLTDTDTIEIFYVFANLNRMEYFKVGHTFKLSSSLSYVSFEYTEWIRYFLSETFLCKNIKLTII